MTPANDIANDLLAPPAPAFTCRLCGHAHRRVALGRGQRAHCTRCGALLARRGWLGRDTALAFAVTGAALAVPSTMLPFIVVSKFGADHTGFLLTGVSALWEDGMRLLAIWTALCGVIAPMLLLTTLVAVLGGTRFGDSRVVSPRWHALAAAMEHWAMPEVHVLAVLVALIKLGTLVNVHIEIGFWCYIAMSFALLVAARSFDFELSGGDAAPRAAVAT